MPALKIVPVPVLSDNYSYLIINEASMQAILVDPAGPAACLAAIPAGVELAGVLTTHHHEDHSGGNAEIKSLFPSLPIFAGAAEDGRVPAATHLVGDGEAFTLGGIAFTALHTPCHTRGHICFYTNADESAPPAVFSGDTLFLGGCGRFFEGEPAMMHASLAKLAALPSATRVFCGHEYTVANLKFGAAVEPSNVTIAARATAAADARAQGMPTVGAGTIGDELETNVFMRTRAAAVRAYTHSTLTDAERAALDDTVVLGKLRELKNSFK